MTQAATRTTRMGKISPQFAARLAALAAEERVRAILLLQTALGTRRRSSRPSQAERRSMVEAVRSAGDSAMDEIDDILERYGGERLAERANALGSVPVETTRSGIWALAESGHVSSILEDQEISRLRSH